MAVLPYSAVTRLSFSPNGKVIETGSYQKTVMLWNVGTGVLDRSLQASKGLTRSVSFSPDSRKIAVASDEDLAVRLWDTGTGRLQATLIHPSPYQYANGVENVAFSPDGRTLITSSNRKVYLWDLATQQFKTLIDENAIVFDRLRGRRGFSHSDTIYELTVSSDGKMLATASRDNTAKLWNLSTGQLHATLPHKAEVLNLAFASDGQLLATGSEDATARVWDVQSGQLKWTLRHRGTPWSLGFSHEGRFLFTAADNEHAVKMWSIMTGRLVATLSGARYPSTVSPDGRTLATGAKDNSVLIWDIPPR
jgi:WD40 repeat protein